MIIRLLEGINKGGLSPNSISFNTAIHACARYTHASDYIMIMWAKGQ